MYELARRGPCPTHQGVHACIQCVGLATFRPDAIAYDRVRPTLEYLARFAIRPIYSEIVEITPPMIRDLWRFQLNAASGERLRLLDALFGSSGSVVTLFRYEGELPLPCAVLMADAKGSAWPELRDGWELRSFLESPNRTEVYVHTADEPADSVREGAILLGSETLARVITGHGGCVDQTSVVLEHAAALAPTCAPMLRDDLLLRAAREHEIEVSGADPWAVLRALGATVEMVKGPPGNLIGETGSKRWWDRAGLLSERLAVLEALAAPDEPSSARNR